MRGRYRFGGSDLVVRSFDGDVGHDPIEPLRHPPVGPADEVHQGGHEHCS